MRHVSSTEEYTITITKQELFDIAEGLESGSRHRYSKQSEAIAQAQHASRSPALEGRKAERYMRLRNDLFKAANLECPTCSVDSVT